MAALAALTLAASGSSSDITVLTQSQHGKIGNRALPHFSGGLEVAFDEERQAGADAQPAVGSDTPPDATATALGCANRGSVTNPRANQDCTLRRQAEEQIAVNPIDPNNIVVGQNDSRVGFNHCGFDYSLDGGSTFGDGQPPFFHHLNPGTLHSYDAASDPAVSITGTGRAWYSCVAFDLNTNASAVFASPSTPELKGSAYADIGAGASPYVVAETNDGHTFYDKEFIAADTRAGHEELYETFTVFIADQKCSKGNNPGAYCSSEIWYSKWDPAAGKFTPIANVSGSSASLCVLGDFFDKKADPNACNFDQGSMPVVLPNGDVYVVWNNGNTPLGAPNQTLGRLIHPDGTMGPVVRVGTDDWRHQALCDFGRGPEECVDSINVRTNDFPAIAVDPTNASHLVAVWQDSRNSPNADGDYGIAVSESTNGGASWTETKYLKGAAGEAYFEPSVTITKSGKLAVSYYKANVYGNSDGKGTYGYYLVSRSGSTWSAPTLVSDSGTLPSPQLNPTQAGFLGDYSSIAASTAPGSSLVYPNWSDTRNLSASGQPDEDVFIAKVAIP
jgi:hypothetical protein